MANYMFSPPAPKAILPPPTASGRGFETPPRKTHRFEAYPRRTEWDDKAIPEWLSSVPIRLRQKLVWAHSKSTPIPEKAIILLFVGDKDADALDQVLCTMYPETSTRIFAIDLKRCARTNNFLSEEPYFSLCTAAAEGNHSFVGGGPMCRTFSIKRLIQQDNCKGMLCRGRWDFI
jgi:hypothetical protein